MGSCCDCEWEDYEGRDEPIRGIPLNYKPPQLSEEEKILRDTALRRYKRRLRREEQNQRREQAAIGQPMSPTEEEETVSADTEVTVSTMGATMVYGRGDYELNRRRSSFFSASNLSFTSPHGSFAEGASRSHRSRTQRQRQRMSLVEDPQTGGVAEDSLGHFSSHAPPYGAAWNHEEDVNREPLEEDAAAAVAERRAPGEDEMAAEMEANAMLSNFFVRWQEDGSPFTATPEDAGSPLRMYSFSPYMAASLTREVGTNPMNASVGS